MDKKALGIIAVCLLLVVGITVVTKKKDTGVRSIKSGTLVWVKCNSCEAEYQLEKSDYYTQVQEKRVAKPMSMMNVPVDCQKCQEESVHLAEKGGDCNSVFIPSPAHSGKCPKCGISTQ